jgi:hypothetical protein
MKKYSQEISTGMHRLSTGEMWAKNVEISI